MYALFSRDMPWIFHACLTFSSLHIHLLPVFIPRHRKYSFKLYIQLSHREPHVCRMDSVSHCISIIWYKRVMRRSLVVYHGISPFSLVFSWYTKSPKASCAHRETTSDTCYIPYLVRFMHHVKIKLLSSGISPYAAWNHFITRIYFVETMCFTIFPGLPMFPWAPWGPTPPWRKITLQQSHYLALQSHYRIITYHLPPW